jgi:hypothetical protein
MDIQQLKAKAYDLIATRGQIESQLNQVNQMIAEQVKENMMASTKKAEVEKVEAEKTDPKNKAAKV